MYRFTRNDITVVYYKKENVIASPRQGESSTDALYRDEVPTDPVQRDNLHH